MLQVLLALLSIFILLVGFRFDLRASGWISNGFPKDFQASGCAWTSEKLVSGLSTRSGQAFALAGGCPLAVDKLFRPKSLTAASGQAF